MKSLIKPGLQATLFALILFSASCSSPDNAALPGAPAQSVTLTTQPVYRATPVAQEPAAGICASFDGPAVEVTLLPGIPDPRCAIVRPDQLLTITNQTGSPVEFTLGQFTALLDHEASYTIETPFGEYLAPGVHALQVDPCCGGELWLK
jgi:hypothetical protein